MSLEIRKTYKIYLGGEFVRSESGRYDPASAPRPRSASGRRAMNALFASRQASPDG